MTEYFDPVAELLARMDDDEKTLTKLIQNSPVWSRLAEESGSYERAPNNTGDKP